MAGRKPKSTKLKLLEGNPGKRSINKSEPEPTPGIPPIPEWIKIFPIAVKEWERESEILNNMGIMSEAEAGVLATRCYIASQIQEIAKQLKKEGRVAYVSKMDSLGNEVMEAKANPKAIQITNLIKEYRQHGSLLGLDAPSRTKLSVDPGKKKRGKFEGLIGGKK